MFAEQLITENLNIINEGEKLGKLKDSIKKAALPLGMAAIIGSSTIPAIRLAKAPQQAKQQQEIRAEQSNIRHEIYLKKIHNLEDKIKELENGIPKKYEHETHREIWNIFRQYQGDIPDLFLEALVEAESQWHPNVIRRNTDGSYDSGLMQVNTKGALAQYNKIHNTNYNKEQVKNLNLNIMIGTYYLHWLVKNYNVSYDNPELLYIKYHRGPNATEHNAASRQFLSIYNKIKKQRENELNEKLNRLKKNLARLR
jgi:soluble lytic murein transglycosylase-like protein